MKRFHVHLNVDDLSANIRFYSALFASEPTVSKPDYAKWMLEDPRVNFAISTKGSTPGIDHLGIQADDEGELRELGRRIDVAGSTSVPEAAAVCCYVKSEKVWTEDPHGMRWETFHSHGESTTYYAGDSACATEGAACRPEISAVAPAKSQGDPCCEPRSGCC